MNLKSRLEKLETEAQNEDKKIEAIFITIVFADKKFRELLGWQCEDHHIMRLPGESDDDLELRATATAIKLHPGTIPTLITIYEDDE